MSWADRVDPSPSIPRYVAPQYPTVRVRALRPFTFRAQKSMKDGTLLTLAPPRVLDPGEIVEMLEPDALSLAAVGRVEVL